MNIQNDPKAQKTALLITCAAILQMAESFFPQPIPGIKLGLANMITIVALVDLGFTAAIEIAVLRTIISSLLIGTFLSPTFILSFASAITSSLVMGAAYAIFSKFKKPVLSLIGISILGAVAHNLTQISLVYLLLIKNSAVFMLLPWLGISAVIMGWITGIIASRVCEKLEDGKDVEISGYEMSLTKPVDSKLNLNRKYIDGNSILHNIVPELKIAAVVVMAVIIFVFNNMQAYLSILLLLLITAMSNGIAFSDMFCGIKKMYSFIIFSFVLPVIFHGAGNVIFTLGPLKITDGAVLIGTLFTFRIVLLMLVTELMIRTTKSENLLKGIETILKPFKFAGISGARTSELIVTSWMSIPEFWDKAVLLVNKYRKEEKLGIKSAVVIASAVVVSLYRQTKI